MEKIDKLNRNNLISLYDLAYDIKEKTETTNNLEIIIKHTKNPIDYKHLKITDEVFLNNSLELRMNSLKYLKNNEIIKKYEIVEYCENSDGEYYENIIKIIIDTKKFNNFYHEISQIWLNKKDNITNDYHESDSVEFFEDESCLVINGNKCALPPFKNEYFLCKAMFIYQRNEPVDWSIIAESMDKYSPTKKKAIYDTINRINKRVKGVLGIDKLFACKNNAIMRLK
jgi:hypothetical protein